MTDLISTLKRAVPYIRLYKGKTFVIKVGGRILERKDLLDALAEDVTLFHQLGIRCVLVHGGGPQASEMSRRLGIEPRIVAGRRVTDEPTLEIVKMVYGGTLNLDILAALRVHQTPAIGVSGLDTNLVTAKRRPPTSIAPGPGEEPVTVDFGFVGDIVEVQVGGLEHLLAGGLVPVVSSLACDDAGTILNINADSIARSLAGALKAEKLLVLTDTDGILEDVSDPRSMVSYTDIEGIEELKKAGKLSGGMLPKVEACVEALKAGVRRTHILNGTRPGALLTEVFTNAGCGTMVVDRMEAEAYQKHELVSPEVP